MQPLYIIIGNYYVHIPIFYEKKKSAFPEKGKCAVKTIEILRSFDFVAFQTTRADVSGLGFAVLYDSDLLNVGFESSFRFAVTVADVVTRALPLLTNTANSRHINTSTVGSQKIAPKSAPPETSIVILSKYPEKSNYFYAFLRKNYQKIKK